MWLVAEAGALLVRARRAARVLLLRARTRARPARADRIAHLLLALRADEAGFATVANIAFSGAAGACGGGMPPRARPALARREWPQAAGSRGPTV